MFKAEDTDGSKKMSYPQYSRPVVFTRQWLDSSGHSEGQIALEFLMTKWHIVFHINADESLNILKENHVILQRVMWRKKGQW